MVGSLLIFIHFIFPNSFHSKFQYRLTSLGQEQARVAGAWIKEYIAERFDQYYCSEYIRALETASLLGFESARWFPGKNY
jgi:phosphohistidine phosphatase SixA